MNEASALAVNCHTSLCVLSHPKKKEGKKKDVLEIRVRVTFMVSFRVRVEVRVRVWVALFLGIFHEE